jgi:hypothetical protein
MLLPLALLCLAILPGCCAQGVNAGDHEPSVRPEDLTQERFLAIFAYDGRFGQYALWQLRLQADGSIWQGNQRYGDDDLRRFFVLFKDESKDESCIDICLTLWGVGSDMRVSTVSGAVERLRTIAAATLTEKERVHLYVRP